MNLQSRSIIAWVVIGLIAGGVASLILNAGGGLIGWLIAGLIGSVVGGVLSQQFNIKLKLGNPFLEQVIIAIIGAIIVIIIARIIVPG